MKLSTELSREIFNTISGHVSNGKVRIVSRSRLVLCEAELAEDALLNIIDQAAVFKIKEGSVIVLNTGKPWLIVFFTAQNEFALEHEVDDKTKEKELIEGNTVDITNLWVSL